MRTIGAAILGIFLGLIVGILLTEIVGRTLVATGSVSGAGTALLAVVSLLLPVWGLIGGVAGVVIERRMHHRRAHR